MDRRLDDARTPTHPIYSRNVPHKHQVNILHPSPKFHSIPRHHLLAFHVPIYFGQELDHWRIKVYWRFARNYAEHLTFSEALKYLNRAQVTPHDTFMDRMLNELLLTLTQLRMRKRAAGSGY